MQATSRESLAVVRDRFEEHVAGTDTGALEQLANELSEVARVLDGERVLRRYIADPAASEGSRRALADNVFGGKIDDGTLRLLRAVVAQRWSRTSDLVDAVELLSRQALLTVAERIGAVDEVEDELFRFGRVLDSENRLRDLLGDTGAPVGGRLELLRQLVGGKVGPVTSRLLEQAVRAPRGRNLDTVVGQLAELAASRRNRSVAQVVAAAPLSTRQEERLAAVLSRIYGRTVSIQVQIDPEVIGGLLVRIGDEVIDGSIASRLAKASREFPG